MRGRRTESWTLLTPSNRYASRLPGLRGARLTKLITPRFPGARFAQSLVELEPGGALDECLAEREHFVYVLDGELSVSGDPGPVLRPGGFAYRPPGTGLGLRARDAARVLWLQRVYEPWPALAAPAAVSGHRDDHPFEPLAVPGLTRRELIDSGDPAFDFNVSLLRFAPGAALDQVEIHDEEHGLYMTEGAGRYLLGAVTQQVCRDDFVYMAPYCPQSFQAGDAGPAEYLLYKDVFRTGF